MIEIAGSVQRSFAFPADLPLAYAYYSDFDRLLSYLPHICLVRQYSKARFRMLYNTIELGVYHIRIFWDVETGHDSRDVIRVRPLRGLQPVKSETGLYSSTTQGYFNSESIFHPGEQAGETCIDYRLQLHACLPVPLGARFMPAVVLDHVGNSVMHYRMREIADGFIERSIAAFPHWLNELEEPILPLQEGLEADTGC